jgi:hypothetical protein
LTCKQDHRVRTLLLLVPALAVTACLGTAQAAPFKVFSPIVEKGENEVELRGFRDYDSREELDGSENVKFDVGRGFTDYWFSEIEATFVKAGSESLKLDTIASENVFQLTPQGQYWADFGIFAEYEVGTHAQTPNEIKVGALILKEFGPRLSLTLNAFLEWQTGPNHETGTVFSYGASLKYNVNQYFQPALEAFGEPGPISHFSPSSEQENWIGPAVYGKLDMGPGHALAYRFAALFGVSDGASDTRAVFQFEYEF